VNELKFEINSLSQLSQLSSQQQAANKNEVPHTDQMDLDEAVVEAE
jgi:hypothetical protein